jgi:hypothetical protein
MPLGIRIFEINDSSGNGGLEVMPGRIAQQATRGTLKGLELSDLEVLEIEGSGWKVGVSSKLMLDWAGVLDYPSGGSHHPEANQPTYQWPIGIDPTPARVVQQGAGLIGQHLHQAIEPLIAEVQHRMRRRPARLE